jgi:hypothetical protein
MCSCEDNINWYCTSIANRYWKRSKTRVYEVVGDWDPNSRILNLEPGSLQLAAPISWPASLANPAEFKRRDPQLKLYRVNGGRSSCIATPAIMWSSICNAAFEIRTDILRPANYDPAPNPNFVSYIHPRTLTPSWPPRCYAMHISCYKGA